MLSISWNRKFDIDRSDHAAVVDIDGNIARPTSGQQCVAREKLHYDGWCVARPPMLLRSAHATEASRAVFRPRLCGRGAGKCGGGLSGMDMGGNAARWLAQAPLPRRV